MRGFSLRTKVFFLFAGASLLIVVPAMVLVARAVEGRVYERATEELARAADALAINWKLQDEVLHGDARVRAVDARIVSPLLGGEAGTLKYILERRLAEGRVIVAADSAAKPLVGPIMDSATVWRGVGLGSIVVSAEAGEAPLRLAVWPVWADGRPIGLVGVGTRLDERTAQGMRDLLGTEVALIVDGVPVASTLPDSAELALEGKDLALLLERGGTWRGALAGQTYLFRIHPLPTRGAAASVLLFRPVAHELRIAAGIRQSLFGIGIAALVLSLLLAFLVSRIVARPAQALAAAAAELARGEFSAPLPRASRDEIGQLAAAFDEMRGAIATREARLRSAQVEMIHREKLAAMGRLVAQLSHEINNPIYNIQNCLEALARRGDPHDPNREFLELAQEELDRMAVLTRQLLDQSRPLSDAATAVDLNAIAQRVLTLAERELDAHGIRTVTDFVANLPEVVAHADGIHQVLVNLVNNAADAMPGGGTLHLATAFDGEGVEISVSDTGTGIDDADLQRIFEAFYTTKPGVRGVGLGLFVSEGIVRGHRGKLTVTSRAGEGSRFVVRLPRETLDPLGADRPAAATAGASPAATFSGSRA
jgi:signal transduction histidine kinase